MIVLSNLPFILILKTYSSRNGIIYSFTIPFIKKISKVFLFIHLMLVVKNKII